MVRRAAFRVPCHARGSGHMTIRPYRRHEPLHEFLCQSTEWHVIVATLACKGSGDNIPYILGTYDHHRASLNILFAKDKNNETIQRCRRCTCDRFIAEVARQCALTLHSA